MLDAVPLPADGVYLRIWQRPDGTRRQRTMLVRGARVCDLVRFRWYDLEVIARKPGAWRFVQSCDKWAPEPDARGL